MSTPLLLLPPPLSYRSQAATGGQCSAIAGSSGSAANWEEDGREVAPRVVAQGPQVPADKLHQWREEGGVSVQDGNGDGGRHRSVAPPILRVVGSGFAILLQKIFPGAHAGQGSRQHPQQFANDH